MRGGFERTVKACGLIQPVDAALVEAGRRIASQIDWAVENGEGQEVTKALYLMPHLVNILKEMLATPAARQLAGVLKSEVGSGDDVDDLAALSGEVKRLRSVR